MELTSRGFLKNLLKKHGFRPSKGLGQHFLVSRGALNKVVQAAELSSEDIVLEIGPGLGTLTRKLAKNAKMVVAIEKDRRMISVLQETLAGFQNINIVQGDALETDLASYKIQNTRCKLVANLPYYITAHVIRKFLEAKQKPKLMVLMVQKEVAQRICAKPPDMNLLAVSVQFYAEPNIISYVPKSAFWPMPEVDSAILRIAPLINADKRLINADLFFRVARAGFSQPRKQLVNNLKQKLNLSRPAVDKWLLVNGISPTQRAETLSVKDWINLSNTIELN